MYESMITIGKVLKNAKTEKEACRILNILEAFSTPYMNAENLAPLLLSLGRALYA